LRTLETRVVRAKSRLERWLETAQAEVRLRPRRLDTWMLERQLALIDDAIKLQRESKGATRH
jgi:hypothetical protein